MNMIFTWRDGKCYGGNVDGLVEMYKDILKKKRVLPLSDKQNILWKHNSLKDTNEKVICSGNAWNNMNNKQKNYITFIQDKNNPDKLHIRAKSTLQRQKQTTA